MSPSHRLVENLRRTLGDQAAEDLMTWMDDVDSRRSDFTQLRVEISEFREVMRGDVAELRQQLVAQDARLRDEVKAVKFDLLKWSFVYLVVAVTSVAVLTFVLR
jgi:hypothetical protein